jgi:hypothetical protein
VTFMAVTYDREGYADVGFHGSVEQCLASPGQSKGDKTASDGNAELEPELTTTYRKYSADQLGHEGGLR